MPDSASMLSANVDDFRTLFARSSAVPENLRASLRKNIRTAAQVAAAASQREVLRPTLRSGGRGRHTGLRERIAGGIKVSVITAANSPGVVITSTGDRLARAYDNPGGWKHPVFGNRRAWAVTHGRPYFRHTIAGYEPKIRDAVLQAMQEAVVGLASTGAVSQSAAIQGRIMVTRGGIRSNG
jgi:hypothetical protein